MSIAFFTEMGFTGKIPRNHENMRTEFAWMCALNADHYNYREVPNKQYDLGIIIIPKKDPNFDLTSIKKYCKKVGVMQEGPHWCFQDYELHQQIWYYNTIRQADYLYTHNKADKEYYEGLTEHPDVRILPTLMIEDTIKDLPEVEREGIMIGGNFVSWYGGFDSFTAASFIDEKVYSPSMGRKKPGEEQLGIIQLPYMNWNDWIKELNKVKYGIHLMRTQAAGTFALNCAYLGIPCVGYKGLDTQEICHPELTIEFGDIKKAKELLAELKNNSYFYYKVSVQAKENYNKYYHEDKFNTTWKKQS